MKDFPLNNPLLTQEQYDQMYAESFANKEQFWSKIAKEQVTWFKDFTKIKNTNYEVNENEIIKSYDNICVSSCNDAWFCFRDGGRHTKLRKLG